MCYDRCEIEYAVCFQISLAVWIMQGYRIALVERMSYSAHLPNKTRNW